MGRLEEKLGELEQGDVVPEKYAQLLKMFVDSYRTALTPEVFERHERVLLDLVTCVEKQCQDPFLFEPYHERVRHPFDYYQFGIDMLEPLVDKGASTLRGLDRLKTILEQLRRGDNVIFLANHQTEADPHAISILLSEEAPSLGEEMIFVAGERVLTDPLAAPFSMGRNLLCIYSKRYIDHPPEEKTKKQLHNKRTMEVMSELLSLGGKAIYVAPSGGRDRPNSSGVVEIAGYDPQSIEMFYLMANRAGHPTHFYPMALKTYQLVPPPDTVQKELGEVRLAKRAQIHLAFGQEIDMDVFPGSDEADKHARRQNRASYIHDLVCQEYGQFP